MQLSQQGQEDTASSGSLVEKLHVNLTHDIEGVRRCLVSECGHGDPISLVCNFPSTVLEIHRYMKSNHAILENCDTPPLLYTHKAGDGCHRDFCQVASSSPKCPLCGHYFTRVDSKGSFSANKG